MNATANRPRQQRQLVVLVVLIAALAAVVVVQLLPLLGNSNATPAPAPIAVPPAVHAPATPTPGGRRATPPRSPAGGAAARANANRAGVDAGVEEVHLEKLKLPEPEPIEGRRNPFSLAPEPKPAASASNHGTPAAGQASQIPSAAPIAQGPPPVPPPPPIALKFFGVVSGPGRVGKVAALGDGKFVYHGREGSIIDGRYRILKIGEESIQLEYADGRGRQTIRLSGK